MSGIKRLGCLAVASGVAAACVATPSAQAVTIGKAGGLTYVKASAKVPVSPFAATAKTLKAKCPKGRVVAGGGAQVAGAPGNSFLSGVGPALKGRYWFGTGWHFEQPARRLTVYGVCGKAPRYSQSDHVLNVGAGPGEATADEVCDSGHVTGGGATFGTGDETDWWFNSGFPIDSFSDSDSIRDDGWRSFAFHRSGTPASFMVTSVVCRKGAAPKYRSKTGTLQPDSTVKLTARCRGDSVVTGGGAFASGGSEDASVAASRPYDSNDKGGVPEEGWTARIVSASDSPQNALAYAICV